MRDTQRARVYAWEGQWSDWNACNLTLKEARDVVHWACKKYGVRPARVKQHSDRAYSFSQDGLISFRLDHKNTAIALHEAAHHIADVIFEESRIDDHGPEWLGIYLWLLEGARVAPRIALHSSALAKKLRWVPTWTVSPKRLRRAGRR
jgi:hypothetical protein